MALKKKIVELGAKHGVETAHVAQVAKLSLALYDGFSPLAGMDPGDRMLLFAAAQLHDIGYASDPARHVEAGVSLLLENPLDGLSATDWQSVAAIVALHRRDWRLVLQQEWLAGWGVKRKQRIKKLAAILRIADGLDHGHVQDARIDFCRKEGRTDRVGVACGWYIGNVAWAEGKSDLWEAVFKRPLRLEGRLCRTKDLFGGVVRKKDSALAVARKILYSQYDAMRDQLPGLLEGGDPECLHDYRVAMRRFRAALRFFRPLMPKGRIQSLDRAMAALSGPLGEIRDLHIQAACFPGMERDVAEASLRLKRIIESEPCANMAGDMARLLRVDLPAWERTAPAVNCRAFAERRFLRMLARIRSLDVSVIDGDAAALHAVRKSCRRGRYDAEFAAPLLGGKTRKAAKHLKTSATALGEIRDASILLRAAAARPDGAEFADALTERQAQGWNAFRKGWKRLIEL